MRSRLFARRVLSFGLVLSAAGCFPITAIAQNMPVQPHVPSGDASADASGPNAFGNPASPPDPEQAHMLHKMLKERNSLRQQAIVDDTKRLVDLANELREAVDKSNKDELSLNVVNTANEIEKLAKAVKEKMRDGQ